MKGWVREPVNVKCFDVYARRQDLRVSGASRAPKARVDIGEQADSCLFHH